MAAGIWTIQESKVEAAMSSVTDVFAMAAVAKWAKTWWLRTTHIYSFIAL